MKTFTTLHTNGSGCWSNTAKAVEITSIELQYCNSKRNFGELCVFFTADSWNIEKLGLIYSDQLFIQELIAYLQMIGFLESEANDVSYSEQGMQGDNYVSCDVGTAFIAGLARLDPEHVDAICAECAETNV